MWLKVVLLVLACGRWTSAEIFTAVTDMEDILDTEEVLIKNLENFIKLDQKRVNDLQL
jgi:hypothetical protein